MQFNPLTYLIALPILAGVISLAFPDRMRNITRIFALSVSSVALFVSFYIFTTKPLYWPNISFPVFIADTLAAFIGIGIGLFGFLVTIYSFGCVKKDIGQYFGYLLLTLGSSFGVAFANDFIMLLVFWGFLGLTLYLLVNSQGTPRASAAAKKAIIIIGGTDAFMILGVALIWMMSGSLCMNKIRLELNSVAAVSAYVTIVIACLAKAGAMPFHSWVPDVAEDAPTPVTAYLPASLDKLLGIYLLMRVSLYYPSSARSR
jgi:NADH:ubiquinone oxidoreductase subunit 5 (subunit L)/multisubunit Na+/H+ antiporter MnhA subunit